MPSETFQIEKAQWPLRLNDDLSSDDENALKAECDRLSGLSPYGWGHTIDFGPFLKEGMLKDDFLAIAGGFDQWRWWPQDLRGLRVADVGCFTGGLSALMAARGAEVVYAVDEVPEHLEQCRFLAKTFGFSSIKPVLESAYRLERHIEPGSLDLIVLAGVLYHMSDMLIGLYAMRKLLKPNGVLLLQSHGINDFEHSYANFARFIAGRWWQPTGLCIVDMLNFMGFVECDVRFYNRNNCLGRAVRSNSDLTFKRGLNAVFDDIYDSVPRSLDMSLMAPAPRSD